MEVKKMSSRLIKPFTPTPLNLKNYKISLLDSLQVPSNLAIVLFYESKPESYRHLEESLSKNLVQFYLLAGRFIKQLKSVDCSDQGAEFIEAEAPALDLVSVIGTDQIDDLLPDQFFRADESAAQPLLSVQTTRFACGGMALAVSISHRVFDASSLATFMDAWLNLSTTTNPNATITPKSFHLPSLLPMKDDSIDLVSWTPESSSSVVKKLRFDKAAIASLKSKIAVGKPMSAARAVSAAISKALILLDGVKRGRRSRGFVVFQPVNLRERTTRPHVAKDACGNFSGLALSRRVDASEAEGIGLPELSELIGEAARRCIGEFAEAVSADLIMNTGHKLLEALRDPDTNVLIFSDLSKFGLYEANFGWGEPVWMSIGPMQPINIATMLMSNKDGDGIEAWLYFNQRCFDILDWEFINQYFSTMLN